MVEVTEGVAGDASAPPLTIQAFLEARLDEEQVLAEACITEIGSYRAGDPFEDGSGDADRDAFPSYPWGSEARELAFMATFQPSRILADIAAKRAILKDYLTAAEQSRPSGKQTLWGQEARFGLWAAVRHLAAAYRDHPDWRADW